MTNRICEHDDYDILDSDKDEDIHYTMRCTECGKIWHETWELKPVLTNVWDEDWNEIEIAP